MRPIRIAHLSDLHFSERSDKDVWRQITRFINTQVQPNLILITGDVTNKGTDAEYNIATDWLDLLTPRNHVKGRPSYYIVPGNHDRYLVRGVGFGKMRWPWVSKLRASLFDNKFRSHLCTASVPTITLSEREGDVNKEWRVKIVGLDSNDPHAWFAQGAVKETLAIDLKEAALTATDADIVIALMHHHLLPIPALERAVMSKGRGLRDVANVTGLLNAGSVLEQLSDGQVNVVLHGHEHTPHRAHFMGSTDYAGQIAIIGAGSATGQDTMENSWSLYRVHMNILDLEINGSVYLTHATFHNNGLEVDSNRQLLLTATDIRKSRFIRQNRQSENPTQGLSQIELRKLVRVGLDRSVEVAESSTHVILTDSWEHIARSSTGNINPNAFVEFEWEGGKPELVETEFVQDDENEPDVFRCGVPDLSRTYANKITTMWRWSGAALLHEQDVKLYPSHYITDLRRKKNGEPPRDYAMIKMIEGKSIKKASLTLELPSSMAPLSKDYKVYIKTNDKYDLSEELTSSLRFNGPGHVELHIDYPFPDSTYYLTWPLCSEGAYYHPLTDTLRRNVGGLLSKGAEHAIRAVVPARIVNISTYALNKKLEQRRLDRISGTSDCPEFLSLDNPRSRARAALYGEPQLIYSDDIASSAPETAPGEDLVVLAPILRRMEEDTVLSAGLLRVAVQKLEGGGVDLQSSTTNLLLDRCMLAADEIARAASVKN
jgi:3',5'-cyclic AMP phosphodiesterase CpdA